MFYRGSKLRCFRESEGVGVGVRFFQVNIKGGEIIRISTKSPLKIGSLKGKLMFQPSMFQGRAVKFEGELWEFMADHGDSL